MQYVVKSILFAVCIIMTASGAAVPPDGWRYPLPVVEEGSYIQTKSDVASKGDSVFITWIDNRNGTNQVYFKLSFNKGFTWEDDIVIDQPDGASDHLSIAIDNQMTYLLWSTGTSPYTIKFARSSNRGASWTVDVIENGLLSKPCGSISVDGVGDIHISFRRTKSIWDQIIYGYDEDQGQSPVFEPVYNIPEDCPVYQTSITTAYVAGGYQPQIAFSIWNSWTTAICKHTYKSGATWVAPNNIPYSYMNQALDYGIDLTSDQADSLHLCFAGLHDEPANIGTLCYTQATFISNTWVWRQSLDTLLHQQGSSHPSILAYNSNLQVVWSNAGASATSDLYHALSTNLGDTWTQWNGQKSQKLWRTPTGSPRERYPSISAGANERHVIFTSTDNQDIYHLANDDLLLSDSPKATAYNGGRHLAYHPTEPSVLHAVYFSQGRPHYSRSSDNGQTWSPYHIFKDKLWGFDRADSGYYPTIGLIPEISMTFFPCVAYIDDDRHLDFRYIRNGVEDGTAVWASPTGNPNEYVGAPSLVTYFDTVYVAFPTRIETSGATAVLFIKFHYARTAGIPAETLRYQSSNFLIDSLGVSITIDGNNTPHVVWCEKVGTNYEIYYRYRIGFKNWSSLYEVSTNDDPTNRFPHTDDYGDRLAVTWCNETDNQIWRRRKYLPRNAWLSPQQWSQSGAFAEYPVNAAYDTYVWCEKPSTQFDIRRRSDFYGWDWVSDKSANEYYCHSQLQRDDTPWDLYTIFTIGSSVPYYGGFAYQQYGVGDAGGPEGHSPLYTVETGEDTASVFCSQRDSNIVYENHKVDFAGSELVYTLPFLEPTFPAHRIKGTVYFEGNRNKNHEIMINGVKKFSLAVKPNQASDFEVQFPTELYLHEHRVTLSIKNPENSGAYLAKLEVYRTINDKGNGGGPQSIVVNEVKPVETVVLTPNPFHQTLEIKLQAPVQNRGSTSLKIYDTAGRLVRDFSHSLPSTMTALSWNGRDDFGRRLPNGIYFLRLKSENRSLIKKIIMLK